MVFDYFSGEQVLWKPYLTILSLIAPELRRKLNSWVGRPKQIKICVICDNKNGYGFTNQFEVQIINSNKVVVDQTTGLMWQQNGFSYPTQFKYVELCIEDLNRIDFAGYHDWRLPTLEEAMSLINPIRNLKSYSYIDSIFNSKQRWIWTADSVKNAKRAWVVSGGSPCTNFTFNSDGFIRCVRGK